MTAPPREPDAWMYTKEGQEPFFNGHGRRFETYGKEWTEVPLYAAPAPSAEPPAQAATDDLVQRCRAQAETRGGYCGCPREDYPEWQAADLIEQQASEIESLRAECGLRQIQGYNEGKEAASARLYEAEAEQLTRDMRQRAERAEAERDAGRQKHKEDATQIVDLIHERDALRECVRAADGQLSRVLHEMAGSVSLCWEPKPIGIFHSTKACEFVAAAISELRAILRDYAARAKVKP